MTDTKLTKGIGYAKPDSLALVIPITECIYNGSALGKETNEVLHDEVIRNIPFKKSQEFQRDGIKFTVLLGKPIQNRHDKTDYTLVYKFPMPSKILGVKRYDEGWNLENFDEGVKWLQETTCMKFRPYAFAEGRVSDLDNTLDLIIPDKEWSDKLNEWWECIPPEIRAKYGRLFKHDRQTGFITGLQLNDRKCQGNRKVTARFPFWKCYDKRLEILQEREEGQTWGLDYEPGMRKRIECQIRNGYYNQDPILKKLTKPTTLEQVLTVYRDHNEVMTEYARSVLRGYASLKPKVKNVRDMSKEGPEQFIRRELIQIITDEANVPPEFKMTPEQIRTVIKVRAVQAFGHKNGKASKIAKIIDEDWDLMTPKIDPDQSELRF